VSGIGVSPTASAARPGYGATVDVVRTRSLFGEAIVLVEILAVAIVATVFVVRLVFALFDRPSKPRL